MKLKNCPWQTLILGFAAGNLGFQRYFFWKFPRLKRWFWRELFAWIAIGNFEFHMLIFKTIWHGQFSYFTGALTILYFLLRGSSRKSLWGVFFNLFQRKLLFHDKNPQSKFRFACQINWIRACTRNCGVFVFERASSEKKRKKQTIPPERFPEKPPQVFLTRVYAVFIPVGKIDF